MPTSKKRGGAKAHKKRVEQRNQKISLAKKQFEKKYTQMLEEKFREFQEKYSGMTESESEIESLENNENE